MFDSIHRTGWRLLPAERDTLVMFYHTGETLIRKNTLRKAYETAIQKYTQYLVHIGILEDRQRTNLLHVVNTNEQSIVRALFHRLNCQTMRFIAAFGTCDQPCCCDCFAAYKNIACTFLPNFNTSDPDALDSDESNKIDSPN